MQTCVNLCHILSQLKIINHAIVRMNGASMCNKFSIKIAFHHIFMWLQFQHTEKCNQYEKLILFTAHVFIAIYLIFKMLLCGARSWKEDFNVAHNGYFTVTMNCSKNCLINFKFLKYVSFFKNDLIIKLKRNSSKKFKNILLLVFN